MADGQSLDPSQTEIKVKSKLTLFDIGSNVGDLWSKELINIHLW